jgi:tetratricopeptide (TPR) repeat protein
VLGWKAGEEGQVEQAKAHFEESLAIRRDYGDRAAIIHTLLGLHYVARAMGDATRATVLIDESLALSRGSGNKSIVSTILGGAGEHYFALGEHERAEAYFEEDLALTRELGWKPVGVLLKLAKVAQARGDEEKARALFETAREAYEEHVATCRELRDQGSIGAALNDLGDMVREQGDYAAARAHYAESLAIRVRLGYKAGILRDLAGLVAVAVEQGQHERAACLMGVAGALREAMGASRPPVVRAEHDRTVAIIRTALGDEAFAAAWAEGRAMPLEQVVAYATQETAAAGPLIRIRPPHPPE